MQDWISIPKSRQSQSYNGIPKACCMAVLQGKPTYSHHRVFKLWSNSSSQSAISSQPVRRNTSVMLVANGALLLCRKKILESFANYHGHERKIISRLV